MSQRSFPAGFIALCPPKPKSCPRRANGCQNHDGFCIIVIVRKCGARVRLYDRPGHDLTARLPLIVGTLAPLLVMMKLSSLPKTALVI
jgi:hypothetical protein